MASEEKQKHTIGIIGGGKSGHAMLRFLMKTNVADIVFVMDPEPNAPAMQVAYLEKIPAFTKMEDVLRLPMPEFIFEITINQENSEKLKQHLKGKPTRIINSASSRLMVNLVEDNRMQLQEDVSGAVQTIKADLMATLSNSRVLVDNINRILVSMQMLALNASIEAAKVGQAGKGFAVVADNITKFVDSVRKLTQEINDVNKTLITASGNIDGVLEKLH